ncbi:MAG TPA: beta-ketoacyl synthase N-terminal-like domain-containing protein [Thermoanaerobaculia bacterium]|nr:beta-ketoacyl synthase N-terminal-like domain-containing protein [Thermoanaerobaculia bacterium]
MTDLREHPNAIAITGLAGRFPGAADLDRFWANLRDGVESITFFSDEELRASGVGEEMLKSPAYVRAKPYLEGIDLFDAGFFGFTPREASLLDPQQRVFLECAWEALENAGYDAERFPGRIGVYGGANLSSYMLWNLLSNPDLLASVGGVQGRIGVDKDFLTTQVSYRMNLRGPSFAVQTACSTSLVAVHVASQSLLDGECDMALAGGVGVNLPQKVGYVYHEGSIYSPDGHCRAFDADARGTVLGDGAGIVVLRRLADALAAGDRIRAVIRGSAINNDGSGKVGYTAPSLDAQAEVIAEALGIAGVEPETVGAIEGHGTGTRLGDPIEVAALTRAFRSRGASRRGFCALGSVKTNVGHLDAAAGVAGLIKTVLALEHGQIPPSLGFAKPNPEIDFAGSPFFVNDRLRDWPSGGPRRAGVSSFGVGGTNAHVVLEEAPAPAPAGPSRPWQLLPLSAKTATALQAAAENLGRFLSGDQTDRSDPSDRSDLPDVAFTLQNGRRAFAHRRAIVARDAAEAAALLRTPAPDRTAAGVVSGGDRPVVFLFPGQGSQHPNMAVELYRGEAVFRQEIDRCAEILTPHLGLDLREVLYPAPGSEEEAARRLERTELTQPALFAVEYSLARLWMSWGVRPAAMLGHSVGEYVAACLADVMSLEDALSLIAARGRLIQGLPAGAMLAVPLPESEVAARLTPQLSLAAVNGPELCVVSGPEEAVEALRLELDTGKVECTRLHTSHAFHSEMMAPILGPFTERASRVKLAPPRLPYLSNVTGTWIRPEEATDPRYWALHVRQTVRFADGLAEALADPERILLEVGPGQALTTLASQMPGDRLSRVAVPSLRRPKDDPAEISDLARMLHALGRLWSAGAAVSWESLTAGEQRRRVPLPTYPFERQRYWIEPGKGGMAVATVGADGAVPEIPAGGGLTKQALDTWFYLPAWREVERMEPPAEDEEAGSWLVFLDEGGLGSKILDHLRVRGTVVRAVVPGEAFEVQEDGTIILRPGERKDYDLLMKETRSAPATHVLHLWNVTGGGSAGRNRAFWSLLYLVQALGEESPGVPVRIGAVADGFHDVTSDEASDPEKALALGLCRVVPQESRMSFRSFDVVSPPPGPAAEALAARLVAELAGAATDPVVAFRGRRRWVQGWENPPLDARWSRPAVLREGGAWLITGGLDPTSLVFARHLVRETGARVALVVPPGFPTRGSWDALLASSSENGRPEPIARVIRTVRELEAGGGEILLVPVDPATEVGAREAVHAAVEHFGALRGVLHTDMFPGAGLIQLKTPEASAPVLRPKLDGTRALAAALKEVPIEIFVLFSSTIAVTGGLGQVDFCAANNFLDLFAETERAAGRLPVVTLDWGAFRWEEWQEQLGGGPAGMQEELKRSLTLFGIDEPESWEAFSRALATGTPRVVISTGDLETVIAHHNALTAGLLAQQPGAAAGGGHPRPALSTPYAPPSDEIEEGIATIWQEMLGFEPVGIQDNFFELAGNSLTAIQIITRIRKAFDVDLSMSAIFETPTIAGLAGAVRASRLDSEALAEVDQILDEIEGLSAEELERLLAEEMEMGEEAHGA